jgi:hypothetical protein
MPELAEAGPYISWVLVSGFEDGLVLVDEDEGVEVDPLEVLNI